MHMECSSGIVRIACDIQNDGTSRGWGQGREAQANMEETDRDCRGIIHISGPPSR